MPRKVFEIIAGEKRKTKKPAIFLLPRAAREELARQLRPATAEKFRKMRTGYFEEAVKTGATYGAAELLENTGNLFSAISKTDVGAFDRLIKERERIINDVIAKRHQLFTISYYALLRKNVGFRYFQGLAREFESANRIKDAQKRAQAQEQILKHFQKFRVKHGQRISEKELREMAKEAAPFEKMDLTAGRADLLNFKLSLLQDMLQVKQDFLTLLAVKGSRSQLEALPHRTEALKQDYAKLDKLQKQCSSAQQSLEKMGKGLSRKVVELTEELRKDREKASTENLYR